MIEEHGCEYASLDHDLGDFSSAGGDGYDLVLWMAEDDRCRPRGVRIHSANPVGLRRMLGVIDRYGADSPGWTHTRGDWSG